MEENKVIDSFKFLNDINVNDRVKTKMNLNYLSWADAWDVLKTNYPDAIMTIYTRKTHITTTKETINDDGSKTIITVDEGEQEIPYFTDTNSCFVKIGVTIGGKEEIEYYPIMDLKNNAVKARSVTSTDVNKAIQRGFVKCVARHGLGLYIYTGEDLPNAEKNAPIEVTLIDKDDFKSVQSDVITLIQALCKDNSKAEEVTRYIQENFSVKISQTTEQDTNTLKRARDYLKTLM